MVYDTLPNQPNESAESKAAKPTSTRERLALIWRFILRFQSYFGLITIIVLSAALSPILILKICLTSSALLLKMELLPLA